MLALIGNDLNKEILNCEEFEYIKRKLQLIFRKFIPVIDKRLKEKRTQKIHGDLHSENIFVTNKNTCQVYVLAISMTK